MISSRKMVVRYYGTNGYTVYIMEHIDIIYIYIYLFIYAQKKPDQRGKVSGILLKSMEKHQTECGIFHDFPLPCSIVGWEAHGT